MAEANTSTDGKRNIMIAMDGSKHAIYAFECKFDFCLLHIVNDDLFY